MKYLEGIDYWVRFVEFPNAAAESVAVSNGDGTFTIFLNTLFSEDRLADRLQHELRHLEEEHFYRDDLSIEQIERSADGAEERAPNVFIDPPPTGKIACFHSLESMAHYLKTLLRLHRQGKAV